MIWQGVAGHRFDEELVIPIIENTPRESQLADLLVFLPAVDHIIAEYHPEYHGIYHSNPNINSRNKKTAPLSETIRTAAALS